MKNKSNTGLPDIFKSWTECDQTERALLDDPPPAFGVDRTCKQIEELLAGGRNVIITGESGTGKTAVIYEIIRQGLP